MNDQSSSSQPRTVGADPDNGLMQGLRQWIKNLRKRNGDHSVREAA